MKRCSQCGDEVADDLAVFCPNCGSTFAPSGMGVPSTSSTERVINSVSPPSPEKVSFFEKLLRALGLARKQ